WQWPGATCDRRSSCAVSRERPSRRPGREEPPSEGWEEYAKQCVLGRFDVGSRAAEAVHERLSRGSVADAVVGHRAFQLESLSADQMHAQARRRLLPALMDGD